MCEAFSLRSWRGLVWLVRPIPRRRGLVRELQGGKRRIEQLWRMRRRTMPRLKVIETEAATGEVKELFEASQQEFGNVFHLFKGLANAPLALEAYLTLEKLIAGGKLSPVEQDIVRLRASEWNGCEYCLGAHTMTAEMKGLPEEEIHRLRRGEASEPSHAALVRFTSRVLPSFSFPTQVVRVGRSRPAVTAGECGCCGSSPRRRDPAGRCSLLAENPSTPCGTCSGSRRDSGAARSSRPGRRR